MSIPEYGSVDWAMQFARDYRNENRAKDALAVLADEILTLRAENRLFRELIGQIRMQRAGLASETELDETTATACCPHEPTDTGTFSSNKKSVG